MVDKKSTSKADEDEKPSKNAGEQIKKINDEIRTKVMGGKSNEVEFDPSLDDVNALVSILAKKVSSKGTSNKSELLGAIARMTSDSLLNIDLSSSKDKDSKSKDKANRLETLGTKLEENDQSSIMSIFFNESGRIEDYRTYSQIYDFIPEVSEAVQNYTDNIISPNDFTNLSIQADYITDNSTDRQTVKERLSALNIKYNIDQRIEDGIISSLTHGDEFIAVFNLRNEFESMLNSRSNSGKSITHGKMITETATTYNYLSENATNLTDDNNAAITVENANMMIHNYINLLLEDTATDIDMDFVNSKIKASMVNAEPVVDKEKENTSTTPLKSTIGRSKKAPNQAKDATTVTVENVRGSVIKRYRPENVIKLFVDDVLFGYYAFEYSEREMEDMKKRGSSDFSGSARLMDRTLSNALSSGNSDPKKEIISKALTKAFIERISDNKFINTNTRISGDVYAILKQANEKQARLKARFIAVDQMIHLTPNGALNYGDSILSRIKFFSKLYVGAMTNAFMRNTIRQNERLVWYIDVGLDNDANNAVQNFIRTVKQKEIKFNNLKDISTTINNIGEFHDFYIPTINGDKPVDVEILNMGSASEVDNPYLQFLKKTILAGTGVPPAYIGASEEIQFAKSIASENGRYLRRVVRIQRAFNPVLSKLYAVLYRNEFQSLDEILGKEVKDTKESIKADPKKKADAEVLELFVDISKIKVKLPVPNVLNIASVADIINQVSPVADFIVTAIAPGDEEESGKIFKGEVIKSICTQLDWDIYDSMYTAAKIKAKELKIEKDAASGGGATDDGGGEA